LEKEVYELLDTALKIGLGALISGTAAYFLANQKYNNDLKKESRASVRLLLSEAASKIEKARHTIEESNHPFWEHVIDRSDEGRNESTKNCLSKRLEASALLSEVCAISSLLGLTELREHLDIACEKLDDAYQTIASDGAFESADKLNSEMEEIVDIFSKCLDKISKAYKNA
jgi:hypothetical protein